MKACRECYRTEEEVGFEAGRNICNSCRGKERRKLAKIKALKEKGKLAATPAAPIGDDEDTNADPFVPTGHHLAGVSTLLDAQGNVKAQWIKTSKDREQKLDALMKAAKDIAKPFKGTSSNPKTPKISDDDLLCVYPMGDPHFGMFSWHEETGQDFNLELAESSLVSAVDKLVGLAPSASQALIINLGDFFHTDNASNMTSRSKNPLDVDTRWAKMLGVGIRAMRRVIDKALEKHKSVRVVCEIGNHDDHSAIMLAICLQQYYENNPRVDVDTSPSTFHWHRFGENLIGITHGDKVKAQNLPAIMAHDKKEDWGETTHRYWYTGHVHHDSVKEYPGCIVETFRTLAPKDFYHHSHGYRSDQDMKCDVLHRKWGRINRHIVGIRQVL